jgi:hypothetical protein
VANAPGCTSASAAYCTYAALDVPTFTASRLSRPHPASDPGRQSRNYANQTSFSSDMSVYHDTEILHNIIDLRKTTTPVFLIHTLKRQPMPNERYQSWRTETACDVRVFFAQLACRRRSRDGEEM